MRHPLVLLAALCVFQPAKVLAEDWTAIATDLLKTEKTGFGGLCGVVVHPSSGDVIINLSDRGLFRSRDQGKSWQRLGTVPLKGRTETPGCLMIDPIQYKRLVSAFVYGSPIIVSPDLGASWTALSPKSSHVDWCAVDWSDEELRFILTLKHESGDLLLASRDGGKTFEEIGKGYGPAWIFDGRTAVVAEAKSSAKPRPGLLRTTDAGKTFQPCGAYYARTLPRFQAGTLYWLAEGALIASTDQGKTWKKLSDVKDGRCGPVFGKDAQHLFVLTTTGIRESKDGGVTWENSIPLPAAMKGAGNLAWIAYDARHDLLYVMKMGSDLYQWKRGKQSARAIPVDFSRYGPDCGVDIRQDGNRLRVSWPLGDAGEKEFGRLTIDLTPGKPLVESMGIASGATAEAVTLLHGVDPVTFLTVGTRQAPPGRPPWMSNWNVFFDKPASRPHRTYPARLDLKQARVSSEGRRATIALGDLTAGPFMGEWAFTFYPGSRLVRVEAIVSTAEDGRAILYDAGLAGETPGWQRIAWMDTDGKIERRRVDAVEVGRPVRVRHRTILAENDQGAVACLPPPHQYQFPRDWTDNLGFVWIGKDYHGLGSSFGLGVRQQADGKRPFEPWFNAPPNTRQRLGVFYLLTRGKAEDALRETLRYTRGDRFAPLPGHVTFTSHYHMAVAVAAMRRQFQGTPEFVGVFKHLGVNAVHLADFHGDGHQRDPGPLRLPELAALFKECRRLSDADLLMIPGEEASDFLGIREPGKNPGHWMSLFPRPVYWVQQRVQGQPFEEQHAEYGTVYRVGNQRDMMELLQREKGLAWTAHPRIKASSWTPDIFRREPFYLADYWLGAAWKAMPADLSRPRLGERGLNLLDDMANWGQRKYLPGEVDVFQIDHTHELYGHMNVNYLRLERLPRFDDGWQPILDTLRGGRFFVTTGEVLLRDFTVGGKKSGETLTLEAGGKPEVQVELEWTFPLQFAEVSSGDGKQVYRERIDLTDTSPFGRRMLRLRPDLRGRKWVRFEVWDAAVNGAFTQPVWLE
jgi:hypothetical protein